MTSNYAAGRDEVPPAVASIVVSARRLSHQAAEDVSRAVLRDRRSRTVVLDLNQTEEATTAAFARLVRLRRDLLNAGRDLRLRGLKARAAQLWRISRLAAVLPVQ
jgi:anti-anti-sigma regulatory factor